MSNMFKRLFFYDKWNIAYRFTNKNFEDGFDFDTPFRFVSMPKNHWGADPFLINYKDRVLLFCEYTNEKKSKSYIAFKELYPNEDDDWKTAYEFAGHSSYPCVFEYKQKLYMIPETVFENNVVLLQFDEETNKWKKISQLFGSTNSPDSTFLYYKNKPSLFLYTICDSDERKLYFCTLSDDLLSMKSKIMVKKYNCADGRPGGNCIFLNGKNIRVVQPGINRYGEKIVFYEFGFDKENSFFEKLLFEIKPQDILIETKTKILGIHTYNSLKNIEVIDLFVKGKFDLFRPAKLLFKRLGIFGFGMYDYKKKYINKEFENNKKEK